MVARALPRRGHDAHPLASCSARSPPSASASTARARRSTCDGSWWTVVGILEPVALAPEIDRAALVGYAAAVRELGAERAASTVYLRADPAAVESVRELRPDAR